MMLPSKSVVRLIRRCLAFGAAGFCFAPSGAYGALLKEDFDEPRETGLYATLAGHSLLAIAEGEGVGGSAALKATYEGYERGSRRIVLRVPLPERGDEVTLSYDVRFDEDFQFVRGGKLHGVGPDRPVTGGNPMTPEGWSARVNFSRGEGARTYLYVQDHDGRYGQGRGNEQFRFQRGQYHSVSLHVRLNHPAEKANGFARVYVDGTMVVDHANVRFRDAEGPETEISHFLFSTFHGGSNPDWAPKDEDGEFLTVHAFFDNIAVYPGKRIRETPGACWRDEP